MVYQKVLGWFLLVLGILIIGWTLLYSYNIFTAQGHLPEFFKAPSEVSDRQAASGTAGAQAQIEKAISEQLRAFISTDSLYQLLNLGVWSMLAFILILGGSQISSLGIKLIK